MKRSRRPTLRLRIDKASISIENLTIDDVDAIFHAIKQQRKRNESQNVEEVPAGTYRYLEGILGDLLEAWKY